MCSGCTRRSDYDVALDGDKLCFFADADDARIDSNVRLRSQFADGAAAVDSTWDEMPGYM